MYNSREDASVAGHESLDRASEPSGEKVSMGNLSQ